MVLCYLMTKRGSRFNRNLNFFQQAHLIPKFWGPLCRFCRFNGAENAYTSSMAATTTRTTTTIMPGGSRTDNVIDTPATRFRFQALRCPRTDVRRPVPHPTVPIYSTFTPRIMGRRAHPLSTCPALDWHFCWVRLIAAPRFGGNQVECPMWVHLHQVS